MNQGYYDKPVKCRKKVSANICLSLEEAYTHFTVPELFKEWYGIFGCWIRKEFENGFNFSYIQDYSAQIVFISKMKNEIKLTQRIENIAFPPADILISFQDFNKKTKVNIEINAHMPLYWFEVFDDWDAIDEIGNNFTHQN